MMIIASLILAVQLDACHVLSQKDVAAVQGERFSDARLTSRATSTTCFYQLPTFAKSISLDLMPSGARKFWEESLEREHEESGEHESEPLRIGGIGSEALWVGARGTGSLYVRKGDAMVRVSVGGPGTQEERIEKSKKLARRALKRF